ncbi:unnamed protein product, partial [Prorocentrum cordatum]
TICLQYQLVFDYSDQFLANDNGRMNTYYCCGDKTGYNMETLIRTERWAQLLTIEQEHEQEGIRQGCCYHFGTKCTPGKESIFVEWIDFSAVPKQAWHFETVHPEYDIKNLKTLHAREGNILVEWIDFSAVPKQAWHFETVHPEYDIKNLKTLCRETILTK